MLRHISRTIRSSPSTANHMAWSSHGRDNISLVAALKKNGLITSDRVADAMSKVDRGNYVRIRADAYFDSPSSIDYGGKACRYDT